MAPMHTNTLQLPATGARFVFLFYFELTEEEGVLVKV